MTEHPESEAEYAFIQQMGEDEISRKDELLMAAKNGERCRRCNSEIKTFGPSRIPTWEIDSPRAIYLHYAYCPCNFQKLEPLLEEDEERWPCAGERWLHYKTPDGPGYWIMEIGVIEQNMEPCVIYTHADRGQVYVRPMRDFLAPAPALIPHELAVKHPYFRSDELLEIRRFRPER